MKIRIKGNSIRIRISRPEVDQFATEGYLQEITEFGNTSFTYALQSEDVPNLTANFAIDTITMSVPLFIQKEWAANQTVGYQNNMNIGNDKTLFLLLEKDFKCIDAPAHEDQSDNFDNPHVVC